MSIPVSLADLSDQLKGRPAGFVITTGPDGRPHVAHQPIDWVGDETIRFPAGASTVKNAQVTPLVCLLFPATTETHDGYSLIVDATAPPEQPEPEHLVVAPTHAVLHRPAPEAS